MNKVLIIPCLDTNHGRVVKGVNFEGIKDIGDPVEMAKKYQQDGADEIVILDISATVEGRESILPKTIQQISKEINIPIIVGGGMKNLDEIDVVLSSGASRVSINSAAVENPQLIKDATKKFGKDKIISAIDAKYNEETNQYEVVICGGKINTHKDAVAWAKEVEELGACAILLTSMDTDGKQSGYDVELNKKIAESVNIPIIASGGAGKLEDFVDVIINGKAKAVLVASLFHYDIINIMQLKEYLTSNGIEVSKGK